MSGKRGTRGRSSVERLSHAVRDAVDAAIADGNTIDEIAALIRVHGGDCSRSAIGRYVKRERDLIRQQRELERSAERWARTLGDRAEVRTGLIATEALRTLTLLSAADLGENGESITTEAVARLALALRHIDGTDGLRIARERAMAGAVDRAGRAARKAGLSPKTVAAIRRAIEGESPG